MIKDLIKKNRSYRRFDQSKLIDTETLREFVNYARLSGCGGNQQPLRFFLSNTPEINEKIFSCCAWAASLKDWPGPAEGEKPTAYIVICIDKNIRENPGCDQGIAAQSILLAAVEKGLGGCMIGSVKRNELAGHLKLPDHLAIVLVIALGVPAEKVVIDETGDQDTTYWRDENNVHHVPKRSLNAIIL